MKMGKVSWGLMENLCGASGSFYRLSSLLFVAVVSVFFILSPAEDIRAETNGYHLFADSATSAVFGNNFMTTSVPGFPFYRWKETTELDYRLTESEFSLTENFILGSAFWYEERGVFDDFAEKKDVNDHVISISGTYYLENFFVDAVGSYGSNGYNQVLNVKNIFRSSFPDNMTIAAREREAEPDGEFYAFSLGTGYTFNRDSFSFGPYLRANYSKFEIDGSTDMSNLSFLSSTNSFDFEFDDGKIESFTTSLGGHAAYVFSTNLGLLTPYMRLEWEHEYENDSGALKGGFVNSLSGITDVGDNDVILITTDKPDRDYWNFGLGLTMVFPNGFMAFMDYETILGLEDIDSHQFAAGLRFEY